MKDGNRFERGADARTSISGLGAINHANTNEAVRGDADTVRFSCAISVVQPARCPVARRNCTALMGVTATRCAPGEVTSAQIEESNRRCVGPGHSISPSRPRSVLTRVISTAG